MSLEEKTLSQKYLFEGKIVKLHVDEAGLPNGATAIREVIDHPGGVTVAVLTEKDEMLFVRQYRYPYHEVVLEAPAGKLEPGEDPFAAMLREQKEETGTTGKNYVSLGSLYPSPGYCNEIIRLYACRIAEEGATDFDDDEFLEAERLPLAKAVEMVMSGEIPDAKTQVLILKTARLVQENKL